MSFELKNPFTTRLADEEHQMLKDSLIDILPEIPVDDLNNRKIMVRLIELSTTKVKLQSKSQPKDLERIQELEKQLKESNEQIDSFKAAAESLKEYNEEYQSKVQELNDEIQNLRLQASENGQKAASLEKYKPGQNEMRLDLPPLTKEVLICYARKVSKATGKEIQPGELLISLFNRYITSQDVELDGFPLIIRKSEIKAINESLKKANESA